MKTEEGEIPRAESLILLTDLREAVAKHGRRGGVRPANVEQSLGLGTLTNNVLIGSNFTGTVTKPEFPISAKLAWAMRGSTVGEGPIIVGLAHSDYTDAEIEAFVENTGSWGLGNKTQQEIAQRKIRIVGKFPLALADEVLNDGKPITTPLRFGLVTGQTIKFWAYNSGGSSLTTGAIVEVDGIVWLKR